MIHFVRLRLDLLYNLTLRKREKKQKKNTNDLQEMANIIASITHKGTATFNPTINSAHMEAVQKLVHIKYQQAKKWTIVEVDSVIEGRNKPKPNNFTLD